MKKGKLMGQGRTAEIFALEDDKVLKLFRSDMAHKSVEKEFALGRLIAETGVPAPAVFEMVSVEGRQGIVYQMVTGKTMLEYISARPHTASGQARRLARLHHKIHQHTVTDLSCQKEILADNIINAKMLTDQEKQFILRYLESLPQGDKLCHGDFHPDNVMLSSQRAVVLDWMNASTGCPAADVARTVLLLRDSAPPPGTAGWKIALLHILRKNFYSAYIREYYKLSDITAAQVEAWMLPVAAARLTEDLSPAEKQVLKRIIQQRMR